MSKRKLTYKNFKEYFGNNLPNKDKHAFEKDMMRDNFEEEAFEGLSTISDEELEKDIFELKSKIDNRIKRTRRLIPDWYKYAASAVVIVGVGLSVFFLNSRFWQDSMIKEQLSEEMKIADSLLFEAELEIEETPMDDQKDSSAGLIAENSYVEPAQEINIVNDDIEIEDELILDDAEMGAKGVEANEVADEVADVAIIEFDEEEEAINEDQTIVTENLANTEQVFLVEEKQAKKEISGSNTEESVQKSSRAVSEEVNTKAKKESDFNAAIIPSVDKKAEAVKTETVNQGKTQAFPPNSVKKPEFIRYILKEFDYSKFTNFPGTHPVSFSFTIESNGELGNFNFTESPAKEFDDELTRIILEAGNWIPATKNNQNVNSTMKLTLYINVK